MMTGEGSSDVLPTVRNFSRQGQNRDQQAHLAYRTPTLQPTDNKNASQHLAYRTPTLQPTDNKNASQHLRLQKRFAKTKHSTDDQQYQAAILDIRVMSTKTRQCFPNHNPNVN